MAVIVKILLLLIVFIEVKCEKEKTKDVPVINIDGQSYSLLKRPPVTSLLVENARSTILTTLNVGVFTKELNKVDKFIQIAYHGLALMPALQGKVTNLAIEIMQFADKSAVSLVEFKLASDRVLTALETTYWFIYNDKENMAKEFFSSIDKIAGQIADTAMNLQKLNNEVRENVRSLLTEFYSTQQTTKDKKLNLTKLQQDLNARLYRILIEIYIEGLVWDQMSTHCNILKESGSEVADFVYMFMDVLDVAERKELWRSNVFMSKAMELYAQWSAIGSICYDTAMELKELKGVWYNLHDQIKENLSEEELLENIRGLAADFEEEMKSEMALLDEQGREIRETTKKYKNEDPERDEL